MVTFRLIKAPIHNFQEICCHPNSRVKNSESELLFIVRVTESSSEHLRSSILNEQVPNKLQVF